MARSERAIAREVDRLVEESRGHFWTSMRREEEARRKRRDERLERRERAERERAERWARYGKGVGRAAIAVRVEAANLTGLGWYPDQIARRVGRTLGQVYHALGKEGVRPNTRSKRGRSGRRPGMDARLAGRNESMRRMRAAGATLSEIGRAHGLSRQRVHQVLAAMEREASGVD